MPPAHLCRHGTHYRGQIPEKAMAWFMFCARAAVCMILYPPRPPNTIMYTAQGKNSQAEGTLTAEAAALRARQQGPTCRQPCQESYLGCTEETAAPSPNSSALHATQQQHFLGRPETSGRKPLARAHEAPPQPTCRSGDAVRAAAAHPAAPRSPGVRATLAAERPAWRQSSVPSLGA